LPLSEAVRRYPNATFAVTRSVGNQGEFGARLRSLGVDSERIIYYGAGLFHHNWHELPITQKEENDAK
jgi:hypothetical protein